MRHSEFRIGIKFYTGAGKWRCTDVGTRTIVAINIDVPKKMVRVDSATEQQTIYDDYTVDLSGPPYHYPEIVFDEYDIEGCVLDPKDL